ncbi:MFS transporter [Peribacillus sp. NPDC058002]|uniref:MFS transporter n=1 Tax=Peribacillus sp. NPDC058002 TaxID=3346301 RepID=UPI0036DA2370
MALASSTLENRTVRKVTRRIVPFIFLLYIVAYLDRANIGYAGLEMNKELGLTSEVFGIVAGIFFLGYFIFEVPSNILLQKYGARVWIARILVTWGIISVATGFAQNDTQLYFIRFFLGVAEAGFFPGIILYFTYWFRAKERAVTISMFSMAIPVSYIIGAPLSTWIMDNINWMDISGWRWMFILEGVPAFLLGIATYFLLTERPKDAKWLTKEEKQWLSDELDKEKDLVKTEKGHIEALKNPKVWYLSLIHFVFLTGSLGVGYWMPQIIKGFSDVLTNTQIGLIATIPYITAAILMTFWSKRSDRKGERILHSALPLLLAAVALLGAGYVSNPYAAMLFITIALTGLYSFKGPFWALPSMVLSHATMAVGVAVINSVGNLGGFIGPYVVGMLKDSTGSTRAGLYFLSIMLLSGFLMLLFSKREKQVTTTAKVNDRVI